MQLRSIVSLACAVSLFTGSALASAVYARRVDELTMERDIYASREENWMNKAVERKETIEQMQTEVEQLTDTPCRRSEHCPYIRRRVSLHGLLLRGIPAYLRGGAGHHIQRCQGSAGRDGGRRHQHLSLWHGHSD